MTEYDAAYFVDKFTATAETDWDCDLGPLGLCGWEYDKTPYHGAIKRTEEGDALVALCMRSIGLHPVMIVAHGFNKAKTPKQRMLLALNCIRWQSHLKEKYDTIHSRTNQVGPLAQSRD